MEGTAILALQCSTNEKNHLGEQVTVSGAAMEDYSSLCFWGIREYYCFVLISHAQTKFGLQVCFQSQPTLWPRVKHFPVPPLLPLEDDGDTDLLHKVPHKCRVSLFSEPQLLLDSDLAVTQFSVVPQQFWPGEHHSSGRCWAELTGGWERLPLGCSQGWFVHLSPPLNNCRILWSKVRFLT